MGTYHAGSCVKAPRRMGLLRTGLVQESFIDLKWTLEEESDLDQLERKMSWRQ